MTILRYIHQNPLKAGMSQNDLEDLTQEKCAERLTSLSGGAWRGTNVFDSIEQGGVEFSSASFLIDAGGRGYEFYPDMTGRKTNETLQRRRPRCTWKDKTTRAACVFLLWQI